MCWAKAPQRAKRSEEAGLGEAPTEGFGQTKGPNAKTEGGSKSCRQGGGQALPEFDRQYARGEKEMKKPTKAQAKVGKVLGEFKAGSLHSGKKGPVVKSKKQAIAIALSEAGMSKPMKGK